MEDARKFADWLTVAIYAIKKRTSRPIGVIQDELGNACGKEGGSYINYLRQGHIPSSKEDIERLVQALIEQGELTTSQDLKEFLIAGGHPLPNQIINPPKIHGPQSDEFNIFIGREEKLEELRDALHPGRIVVLWGPGGVGKTTLIREVIQQITPNNTAPKQFPHGVLYYDFYGPEHTADDALRYIARFFDVEVTQELSPRDAASRALENKQALIVLDGGEEADDLRKICQIRRQCGILIGSRFQHIDLSSKTISLNILSPDEAVAALQAWSAYEESVSDFRVWDKGHEESEKVAYEICEELGRLSLALRLAGRYMLHRGVLPAKFLELWHEWQLSLLHEGQHRQDSLQVLMEKSLEQVTQISDNASNVMAVAGLLSFQPFGSEVVAGALEKSASIIEKPLQDLLKFGLLMRISPERWQVVHRLIYIYAQRIDVSKDVTRQLAAYYTTLAEEQSKLGGDGFRKLNIERAHIMAVLDKCVKQELWEEVQNLAEAIAGYLNLQGYKAERLAVTKYGLKAAQALGDRKKEGVWQYHLGGAWVSLDKGKEAFEHYQQALIISRELGDRLSELNSLGRLGWVSYIILHEFEQASEYIQQTLDIAREIGNRSSEYEWLIHMGAVYSHQDNHEKAIKYYEQALNIAREIGDQSGETWALDHLGKSYRDLGNLEKVVDYFQEGLKIAREINERFRMSSILQQLGNLYRHQSKIDQAIVCFEEALNIAQELGDRNLETTILKSQGTLHYSHGQKTTAIEYFQQVLATVKEIGDRKNESSWLSNLGNSYFQLGEYQTAIEYYQQALVINREIDDRNSEASTLSNLGVAYGRLGEYQTAIEYYQQALVINREIDDRNSEAIALYRIGQVYSHQNRHNHALEYLQQALSLSQESNNRELEVSCYQILGSIYGILAHYETAIEYCEKALTFFQEIENRQLKVQVLGVLADNYNASNRNNEAIQVYQRAIEIDPSHPFIHNNLANVYLELDKLDEAVSHWHQRIKLRPEDALTAHVSLGIIALKQGKKDEAHTHFKTALAVYEKAHQNGIQTPSGLGENKALALLGLGEVEKALDTLRKALDQRQPGDIIHFTYYDLLAEIPIPPPGLNEVRRLLEEVGGKREGVSIGS